MIPIERAQVLLYAGTDIKTVGCLDGKISHHKHPQVKTLHCVIYKKVGGDLFVGNIAIVYIRSIGVATFLNGFGHSMCEQCQ